MNKQEQINQFLSDPIEVGHYVRFQGDGNGSQNPSFWGYSKVVEIDETGVFIKPSNRNKIHKPFNEIKRCTDHIGVDPFAPQIRLDSYKIDIEQMLYRVGYKKSGEISSDRTQYWDGVFVPRATFNPYVEIGGGINYYQRDFVWTDRQKQLLIDSVYNHIEIGKIVLRCRPFDWVEKNVKAGFDTAFYDVVDGKQRVNTIIDFVKGRFKDSYGNYFSELSVRAQRKFFGSMNVTYVELHEKISDEDTLKTFLAINHLGTPQSEDHINFVKNILK